MDRSHSVDPLRLGSAYLLSAGRLTRPSKGPLRFAIAHWKPPPFPPPFFLLTLKTSTTPVRDIRTLVKCDVRHVGAPYPTPRSLPPKSGVPATPKPDQAAVKSAPQRGTSGPHLIAMASPFSAGKTFKPVRNRNCYPPPGGRPRARGYAPHGPFVQPWYHAGRCDLSHGG